MPITLTIQLLTGDTLTYSARPYKGQVKLQTHLERIERMIYTHFDVSFMTHYVELIHENEEQAYVRVFRDRNHYPRQAMNQEHQWIDYPAVGDMTDEEILRIRDEKPEPWIHDEYMIRRQMTQDHIYTEDTLVYAIVQKRPVSYYDLLVDSEPESDQE